MNRPAGLVIAPAFTADQPDHGPSTASDVLVSIRSPVPAGRLASHDAVVHWTLEPASKTLDTNVPLGAYDSTRAQSTCIGGLGAPRNAENARLTCCPAGNVTGMLIFNSPSMKKSNPVAVGSTLYRWNPVGW